MATAISAPQHTIEQLQGTKAVGSDGQKVNVQTISLPEIALFTLLQPQDDPYVVAQQVLNSNNHQFSSLATESDVKGEQLLSIGRM